ncbi:hypothetical protein CNE_BB2p02370 (plasmid) [Cupriavidus necator N-1]|uniref:Uncharacterized protein n=1 Tax=Cupriavidus necator (strain ATCC 43291 / DSM 13513 / CCUG 52238 / LMG 8453 / N-1) TaxID=1042878 RepID=F8GYV3_CUPNN|nr:hypothetical protein CNE_BB2p02370 [Cupriavidus necator N-1]
MPVCVPLQHIVLPTPFSAEFSSAYPVQCAWERHIMRRPHP